jgi:hypothetical protein
MKSKLTDKPVLHLTFLDHCIGTLDDAFPIECDSYGVLVKEDNTAYYLANWVCGKDLKDGKNNEVMVILKSCVIKKRRLK